MLSCVLQMEREHGRRTVIFSKRVFAEKCAYTVNEFGFSSENCQGAEGLLKKH